MADLREQRVCIKFCFKLGKTAAETDQKFFFIIYLISHQNLQLIYKLMC
jgi:hypothetical protein